MSGSIGKVDYDNMWTRVYGDMQRFGPVHRHIRRILTPLLAGIEYESVLDVGCGPGDNLALLCQGRNLKRITGADLSPWAIKEARKLDNGDFHVLDIEQEYMDDKWDLVFCSLLLEHLHNDMAALQNMRMMTGKYFLAITLAGDFNRYRAWDEQVGHVRNYRRGELERKLARTGLRVCASIYWGFPFYSPVARTLHNFSHFGTGKYDRHTRFIANLLYHVYSLNSHRRGDIVIVLAEV